MENVTAHYDLTEIKTWPEMIVFVGLADSSIPVKFVIFYIIVIMLKYNVKHKI